MLKTERALGTPACQWRSMAGWTPKLDKCFANAPQYLEPLQIQPGKDVNRKTESEENKETFSQLFFVFESHEITKF